MKTVFLFRSLMFLARHRYFLAFFFPDLTVVDASADVFDDEDACLDNGSSSSQSESTAFDAFDASADVFFNAEGTCLNNGSSSSKSKLSSDSVIAWLKSTSLSEASTSELSPIIFCTAFSFTNFKDNVLFDFRRV